MGVAQMPTCLSLCTARREIQESASLKNRKRIWTNLKETKNLDRLEKELTPRLKSDSSLSLIKSWHSDEIQLQFNDLELTDGSITLLETLWQSSHEGSFIGSLSNELFISIENYRKDLNIQILSIESKVTVCKIPEIFCEIRLDLPINTQWSAGPT